MEHSNTTKRFIKALVAAAIVAASLFIAALSRGQEFGNPRVSNHVAAINRAGGYTVTNTDVRALENLNYNITSLWSKIIAVYPHIGSTANSMSINMASPGLYNLTYTGSPTFASTGVTYNGTTQYASTGFSPANSALLTDLTGIGIHRRDTHNDADATFGVAGNGNSYLQVANTSGGRDLEVGSRVATSTGTLAVNGLWSAGYSSSTNLASYYNGVNKGNATTTIGNVGNRPLLFGGYSLNTGQNIRGPITTDFGWLRKNAWSDNDELLMYTGFNAAETILSR